jgi:hypothetical protein
MPFTYHPELCIRILTVVAQTLILSLSLSLSLTFTGITGEKASDGTTTAKHREMLERNFILQSQVYLV